MIGILVHMAAGEEPKSFADLIKEKNQKLSREQSMKSSSIDTDQENHVIVRDDQSVNSSLAETPEARVVKLFVS